MVVFVSLLLFFVIYPCRADDVEGRPDANRPHIRYVESDPYFHPSSRAVAAAERAGVKVCLRTFPIEWGCGDGRG